MIALLFKRTSSAFISLCEKNLFHQIFPIQSSGKNTRNGDILAFVGVKLTCELPFELI